MEPTNSPFGWGNRAWCFLHGMTLDPLSNTDNKRAQKEILRALRHILPCPVCRRSYCVISRDLEDVDESQVADYVLQLHDKVNCKLNKETSSKNWVFWKERQCEYFRRNGYRQYLEAMFYFLFVLACNYPTTFTLDTETNKWYEHFFRNIPLSMRQRQWGKIIEKYMRRNSLSEALKSREQLLNYVYGMFELTLPEMSKHLSLEKICQTVETIRKEK